MVQISWVIVTRSEAISQYLFNYCALRSREPLKLCTSLLLRLRVGRQSGGPRIALPGVSGPPVAPPAFSLVNRHPSSSFQSSPRGGSRIGLVVWPHHPQMILEGGTSRVTPFRSSDHLTASQGLYPAATPCASEAQNNHRRTMYHLYDTGILNFRYCE